MDYSKLASKLGGTEATEAPASNVDYAALAAKVGGNAAPVEQPSITDQLGRQAGLTGRHIIEGTADTIGLLSDPVAALINAAGGNAQSAHSVGKYFADTLGLPTPENATERVVGDASRLLVGTGGIVKGASVAAKSLPSIGQKVATTIASNPGYQAASAVGGGTAGGVARENGAGPTGQFVASTVGSLAAPVAVNTAQNIANRSQSTIRNFLNPDALDVQAQKVLKANLDNYGDLTASVQKQLISDVKEALKTGNNLSPDALRRLADYRAVGATPMRSSLTLNPADVTRDQNMAKLSANSRDPAAQELAMVKNKNNATLVNTFNTMGAEQSPDSVSAGQQLIDSLSAKDQATQSVINQAYKEARDSAGRGALIDPHTFTNRANDLLDEALLGGKLPADVRNKLNQISTGKMPLTVDVAEQYKTAIGALQRASSDAAERKALGLVRQALDEAPLLDGQGQQAIDAFNKARALNRTYMQQVEKIPALQAVRDGVEPDKFVNNYILGSKNNISDLAALKSALTPEDLQVVRGQMLSYLKSKAVNGDADEVANVSPSSYNRALKDIGDMKLSLFFSPEDLNMLKTIGRVSSYEKFQPAGSAVNNSNTAAAAFTAVLDRIANSPLVRKLPLGGALIANPAQDVSIAIGARNSLSAPKALAFKPQAEAKEGVFPLSVLLSAGSLASE